MTGWTQKGKVSRSIGHNADGRSLALRPGIKHRPNVAQNGCAEQSNPFDALQNMEQATNRKPKRERWPKKPTPSGKPKDMLTWAGCMGRPGYLMSKGLMTHVSDVVKTERSTNVRL